jgi:hypothetical protein
MLIKESKQHFIKILNSEHESYADNFNFDILNCLCLEGLETENFNDSFFKSFKNPTEIEKWIDLVKSKIVLHEDEDEVNHIICEYIYLQTNNKHSLFL